MKRVFFQGESYVYSRAELQFFRYTIWSVVLGMLYPVMNDGSFIVNLISLLSTIFSIIPIFLCYTSRKIDKPIWIVNLFGIVVLYMFAVGIAGGALHVDKSTFLMTITQDIHYVSLFWLGGLMASSERYMAYFHHIVKKLAKLSVAMCILAIVLLVMTGSFIQRNSEDTTIYHLWWSTVGFAYCGFYGLLSKSKDRKLFISILAFYFILGMAFLKRSCFINVVLIVVLSVLFSMKRKESSNTFRIVMLVLVITMLLIMAIPSINEIVFSSLFGRFNSVSSAEEFDRMIEWVQYWDNASSSQKVLGCGIGNYITVDRYGKGDELSILNALHLGFANIIYKGGYIYAAFYILLYLTIFVRWFRCKNRTSLHIISYGVAISALVSLLYEGSWTYTIDPIFISAPIFYATNYK